MMRTVEIAGAGPAGLAAALAVVRGGGQARVRERRSDVGGRFHGDFQGIENWTGDGDALEELAALGIEPDFDHAAFRECVLFDPDGREYPVRSTEPLWYLVRRGSGASTLDQSLKRQALGAGVTIDFESPADHLPDGGIVAHGPRRADVIAVGYVGETDMADGAFAVVGDALAPAGYAYLMVWRGRATLATCLFEDFHNEQLYLERTLEFFRRRVGLQLRHETKFGGYGNVSIRTEVRRGNLLFAGEAAGFQDALFGFGMRYALVSGHLAGIAALDGGPESYERACARRLQPLARAAVVNRFAYHLARERGYLLLARHVAGAADPRAWLRRYYGGGWWTGPAYPVARAWLTRHGDRNLAAGCREGCDCTWCRCNHNGAAAHDSRSAPRQHGPGGAS